MSARTSPPPVPAAWTVTACTGSLRLRCGGREPAPSLEEHGWALRLVEDDLVLRELQRARAAAVPEGVRTVAWSQDVEADAFEAYVASFRERPGFPQWTRAQWLAWATGYASFRPDLSCLAYAGEEPAAHLVCALQSGVCHVVQMGVAPRQRRRGLASALLERTRVLALRAGASELTLAVNRDNPEARALYDRFGFRFDVRCAVYVPAAT